VIHRLAVTCAGAILALSCNLASAEVFQCLDEAGKILLTDAGCPPGYNVNLVVGEPRGVEDDELAYREQAEQRMALADAERRAAEAEAARLRAELQAQRMREAPQEERMDTLDRKLDSLLERPQVYGGTAVVPVPALPWCGPAGRPWVDCRPRPRPVKPPVARPHARDADRCGTFGCTPGITHAPWDDDRRQPDHWPERYQRR
jgi:hypothetical protein